MTASIAEIVHRQVLRWERRARTAPVEGRGRATQRPVITLSSACGSLGQEIGKATADLLGFDFYDREVVDAIARSADVRTMIVKTLDERSRRLIDESIVQLFQASHFDSTDYLLHLSRVLATIGRHGDAVVVGRGAQFLLDPRRTLRVRTVAPVQWRIETLARAEGISTDAAEWMVRQKDGERQAFCLQNFHADLSDPCRYDLLLNTATMTVEQNADLLAAHFRLRFCEG